MNQNRVPNNDSKIEEKINQIIQQNNWSDVRVCSDDGSVIISVDGDKERVKEISNIVHGIIGNPRVGDGNQEGLFWINGNNGIGSDIGDFIG